MTLETFYYETATPFIRHVHDKAALQALNTSGEYLCTFTVSYAENQQLNQSELVKSGQVRNAVFVYYSASVNLYHSSTALSVHLLRARDHVFVQRSNIYMYMHVHCWSLSRSTREITTFSVVNCITTEAMKTNSLLTFLFNYDSHLQITMNSSLT